MTSIDLFTDTAAILNVFDLGSVMGCPEGMGTIRYARSVYIRALFGLIFLNVFLEKDCNEKKIVVPCLDVIMIAEKYTLKFSFCPKSARKY